MKMRYRFGNGLIVTAVFATITVVSAGIYTYTELELYSDPTPLAEASTSSVTPSTSPIESSDLKVDTNIGILKTSESDLAEAALETALDPNTKVDEGDVVSIMHHMTHQKVKADDKWMSIEMTPKRVNLLIQVIEQKGRTWKHKEAILEIAKKWDAGDFSEIADDHNYFWKLEKGNIGEATGILSKEQEQDFIEKNFKTITITK